jgi:hypothetical protein
MCCFSFSVTPMRVVSGRFEPMRVGHHTEILRALMDDILFKGEENILNMGEITFVNSKSSFEASFGFSPLLYS